VRTAGAQVDDREQPDETEDRGGRPAGREAEGARRAGPVRGAGPGDLPGHGLVLARGHLAQGVVLAVGSADDLDRPDLRERAVRPVRSVHALEAGRGGAVPQAAQARLDPALRRGHAVADRRHLGEVLGVPDVVGHALQRVEVAPDLLERDLRRAARVGAALQRRHHPRGNEREHERADDHPGRRRACDAVRSQTHAAAIGGPARPR
jgi:hypothetical protein